MEATWEPYEEQRSPHNAKQPARHRLCLSEPAERTSDRCTARAQRDCTIRSSHRVSEADRALAFANIEKAAQYYNVNLSETNRHQLGIHPQRRDL
jgi:hypothetical protein